MKKVIEAVAVIETCYPEKFGVPRQPGLVPEAWGRIVFNKAYRGEHFMRGIEGFSHLWLLFDFHQAPAKQQRGMVRPPRLGGNERRGVFATRAPFRPNGMGLSVVQLVKVDKTSEDGPALLVKGVDVVSGTPVFDIKPYIPFCDAVKGAQGGFVTGEPDTLEVVWQCAKVSDEVVCKLIEQSLSCDPRPAYQHQDDRIYGCSIAHYEIKWLVQQNTVHIKKCEKHEK